MNAWTERQRHADAWTKLRPLTSGFKFAGVPCLVTGADPTPAGPQPRFIWDPCTAPPADFLAELLAEKPRAADYGGEESAALRLAHWRQNRRAATCRPLNWRAVTDGAPRNGLAVIVGTGPSLTAEAVHGLQTLAASGAALIGVNTVGDYLPLELLTHYMIMSPRGRADWWQRPGLNQVCKLAFVGAPVGPDPPEDIVWFNQATPGDPVFAEAFRELPVLLLLQAGASVAVPAFGLACRLPGVRAIAFVGVDLSCPGGMARPDQRDESPLGFLCHDCRGEVVKTTEQLFAAALTLSGLALFARGRGLRVINAGGQGLLGSFPLRSPDGRDLSIEVAPLDSLI